MSVSNVTLGGESRRRPVMIYALWIVQALLALLFLFAGGMKLVLSVEEMTKQMPLPGPFSGGSRTVRLGRRLWHFLVIGSSGGHGRDPHDPTSGLSSLVKCLSRFLDLGLPDNRRLRRPFLPRSAFGAR